MLTTRQSIVASIAAMLFLSMSVANADTVYNVNFTDSVGETLTGSITTDGTIGSLATADIVAWTFSEGNWTPGSGGVTGTFSSGSNASILNLLGNLVASSTSLSLPTLQTGGGQFSFSGPMETFTFLDESVADSPTSQPAAFVEWSFDAGTSESREISLASPFVIATATPSAVPLPASAWLLGCGLLGLLGMNRRRSPCL